MTTRVLSRIGAWSIAGLRRARHGALVALPMMTLSMTVLLSPAMSPVHAQSLVAPVLPAVTAGDASPTLLHDAGGPRLPSLHRADGWKLAGFGAAALLLSTADRRGDAWARRPAVRDGHTLRQLSKVGDVTGTWISVGVGPATWLLGRVRDDSGTAVLGLRTSEAVFTSAVTSQLVKMIAGRTRPYASADNSPSHWDLFGGRSDSTRSFTSQHAAMSAAAAVTLAAEWRRQGLSGWKVVGPPIAYALATLTAGSRVRDRQHWLSDVVTGSAVGIASALVVRRWHDVNPRNRLDRLLLPPR